MRLLRSITIAVSRIGEAVAAVLCAAMMVLTLSQVFYRYVLGSPLTWTEEIARYAFVWLIFVGSAVILLRRGQDGHVALTFLQDRLGARAQRWLGGIVHFAVAYVAGYLMVIEGYSLAMRTMAQASPATGMPIGWAYLAIPVAGACMVLVQCYRLMEFARALLSGQTGAVVHEDLATFREQAH